MSEKLDQEMSMERMELNVARGKVVRISDEWEDMSDEERLQQIEQAIRLLEYPAERIGGNNE